jgi:hypothetical protein
LASAPPIPIPGLLLSIVFSCLASGDIVSRKTSLFIPYPKAPDREYFWDRYFFDKLEFGKSGSFGYGCQTERGLVTASMATGQKCGRINRRLNINDSAEEKEENAPNVETVTICLFKMDRKSLGGWLGKLRV